VPRKPRAVGAHRLAVASILAVAVVSRLWGITWGLQNANVSRRPQPDEWAIYWLFRWFDQHHNLNPCAQAATHCFFDWGTLYPYLAFAVHSATTPLLALLPSTTFGTRADLTFVQSILAARVLSVMVSVLTVYMVYYFARRAYAPRVGLVAALITALSTLLIQLAHFGTPDSTTILLLYTALLAMWWFVQEPTFWRFGFADAAAGLAMASEYHMGLLMAPLAVSWLLAERKKVVWLAAAVGITLTVYLSINAYALIDFQSFLAATEHTLRIRTVDSGAEYGDRWARYGSAWLYVIRYALGYGTGVLFTAWMLAGVGWAAARRRHTELLLLSWLVPYFILVSLSPAKFMRYSAPLIPGLAMLAAGCACAVLADSRVRVRLGALVLAGVAVVYTLVYDGAYLGLFSSLDPRSVAASWLTQHAPRSSAIAFEELPNGLLNLPYFVVDEPAVGDPYPQCYARFNTGTLAGPEKYVLTDDYALEEHPGFSPRIVEQFRNSLTNSSNYRLVKTVHEVPTFLGVQFPIDGSPHDWRYPDHVIRIYRHESPSNGASYCYPTLAAALTALYVPSHGS